MHSKLSTILLKTSKEDVCRFGNGGKVYGYSFMQTCEVQLMQTAVHLQKIQIILQTAVHLQKILKMLIMKTTVPVLIPPQTTWTVMGQIHLKNR